VLWSDCWTPPTLHRSTFFGFEQTDIFYTEIKKAYLRPNPNKVDTPMLHFAAPNLQSLATQFISKVCTAYVNQDFTLLLAPDGHFLMYVFLSFDFCKLKHGFQ
jgi:hypothetical protein